MPDGTSIHAPHVLEQALLDHYVCKFQTNRLLGYCRGDYADVPNLMDREAFVSEIQKFPDVNFLTADMIEYMAILWPKDGWWTIS